MTVRLTLPFPPSVNALWRSVKGRTILSKPYRLWRDLAASLLMLQMRGQKPITGPYTMSVSIDRPDRRRRDLSNVGTKAIEDALVTAGVIEDDSLAQRIVLEWSDRAPGKGAECRIEIEAVDAA